MLKFFKIKEGIENEGKYKGTPSLFVTATFDRHVQMVNTVSPIILKEELFNPVEHKNIYIVADPRGVQELRELMDFVNEMLEQVMVTLETNDDNTDLYIRNVKTGKHKFVLFSKTLNLFRADFLDKKYNNIELFLKGSSFDGDRIYVFEINPDNCFVSSLEAEENDKYLIPFYKDNA